MSNARTEYIAFRANETEVAMLEKLTKKYGVMSRSSLIRLIVRAEYARVYKRLPSIKERDK